LTGALPFDARQLAELALDAGERRARIAAGRANEVRREPFLVVEKNLEDMLRRQPLVGTAQRQGLRRLNEALGPFGVFLEIHDWPSPMNDCGTPLSRGDVLHLPPLIWW